MGIGALIGSVGAGGSTPASGSITLAQMADLAQSRIIGRAAGGGTGVPQALTPAEVLTLLGLYVSPWFGTGADGALVFDGVADVTVAGVAFSPAGGVYTIPGNLNATSIHVDSGIVVDLSGSAAGGTGSESHKGNFGVFCTGNLTGTGTIKRTVANGSNGGAGAGAGGVGYTASPIPLSNTAGSAGGAAAGVGASQSVTSFMPVGFAQPKGGNGGAGSGGGAAAGGTSNVTVGGLFYGPLDPFSIRGWRPPVLGYASQGGAGGGGATGAGGGGGGAGGAIMVVCIGGTMATALTFMARGGNGGNGFAGTGSSGGGGGGAGGQLFMIRPAGQGIGSALFDGLGGTGGTAGAGATNGADGASGSANVLIANLL